MARTQQEKREQAEARQAEYRGLSVEERLYRAISRGHDDTKEVHRLKRELQKIGKVKIGPERASEETFMDAGARKATERIIRSVDPERLARRQERDGTLKGKARKAHQRSPR